MREDEGEAITDAINVTSDTSSLDSSSQREKLNAIFAIEEVDNSNKLVNLVARFYIMTTNDVGYELNTATVSDAQFAFASNPDEINHTNNGITHQNLLSIRMIGTRHKDVSILILQRNQGLARL